MATTDSLWGLAALGIAYAGTKAADEDFQKAVVGVTEDIGDFVERVGDGLEWAWDKTASFFSSLIWAQAGASITTLVKEKKRLME